jgi:hypothetical protein
VVSGGGTRYVLDVRALLSNSRPTIPDRMTAAVHDLAQEHCEQLDEYAQGWCHAARARSASCSLFTLSSPAPERPVRHERVVLHQPAGRVLGCRACVYRSRWDQITWPVCHPFRTSQARSSSEERSAGSAEQRLPSAAGRVGQGACRGGCDHVAVPGERRLPARSGVVEGPAAHARDRDRRGRPSRRPVVLLQSVALRPTGIERHGGRSPLPPWWDGLEVSWCPVAEGSTGDDRQAK